MIRIITSIFSCICLGFLVFTDLSLEQWLLLLGAIFGPFLNDWSDYLEVRRASRTAD